MRVEEMALRSEIRQMLNEAGFNKNTLKDLVKEVVREEVERAIKQAINETDLDGYVKRTSDSIIKEATKAHLRDTITQQLVGNWFNRMKVSVDIQNKDGESIL